MEMFHQALHAQEALGDTPKQMPKGEADLRIYIHDAVAPNHDKDYRCLITFPPRILEDVVLTVLLVDYGGRVRAHELRGQ